MRSAVTGFRPRNGRQAPANCPPGRSRSPGTQLSGLELHEPRSRVGCGSTQTDSRHRFLHIPSPHHCWGRSPCIYGCLTWSNVDVTTRGPGQSEEWHFLRGTPLSTEVGGLPLRLATLARFCRCRDQWGKAHAAMSSSFSACSVPCVLGTGFCKQLPIH